MDIASLLSPCAPPPPPPRRQQKEPVRPAKSSDESSVAPPASSPTSLGQQVFLAALDQQIVALQDVTNTSKKASTAVLAHAATRKKAHSQDKKKSLVKRKRKRRLTSNQLQVVLENRSDDSQLYNLTLDVNALKQQVRDFLVHKSIVETRTLVARQRFEAGVLRTTQHYFNLLITGFRAWEPQEVAFFAATFDPNVAIKSLASSVDVLFAKWKMYKTMLQMQYFGISSIRILVSDPESCVVECEGEFEGKLTLTAIEMCFPHILQDQQLLHRVVNRRFVCPTRTMIYFDASGRIVEYNAQADMFAGLSRILASSPKDVITLMSSAHLGSSSSNASDENGSDRVASSPSSDVEVLETSSDDEAGSNGLGLERARVPVSSAASSSSPVRHVLS